MGTSKIRPKQINLELFKNVTKGATEEEDVVNESGFNFAELNRYKHVESVTTEGSNVENQIVVDFNELIYEAEAYTNTDYAIDVGSYLILFCLAWIILFGLIGFLFVSCFMKELKLLINKKYKEGKYLHSIGKYLKKFNSIHQALYEKRD